MMAAHRKGIDVSQWNGSIDWQRVKDAGIEFAMLRAGYGLSLDPRFERNAAECNRVGIPFGVYWFSYATTADGAANEARRCVSALKKYRADYPVAYDFEDDSVKNATKSGVRVTKALASAMARSFLAVVQKAGYTAVNYTNPAYLYQYYDEALAKEYPVWLAQWPSKPDPAKPPRACAIWQYSEKGRVPGISTDVDLDACYVDYGKDEDIMTGEEIYKALNEYMNKQTLPGWAKDEYQECVKLGITDGKNPMQLVPRYQAAIMAKRAAILPQKA